MNSELKIFENPEFGQIRTVEIDGEPWFVGKDVAAALGYERATKAIQDHVDEDDRVMVDGKTQSKFGIELGQRGGWLVNESGVYSLILSSKLPNAKGLKHWVMSDVLPSVKRSSITTEFMQKNEANDVKQSIQPDNCCTTGIAQVFNYGKFPIRTIIKDGEPWWVLADVCRVLEIERADSAARRLDPDEKGTHLVSTLGGNQNMTVINESGLYKVILRSDKPEAKDFTRWVTHEVLPAIRKTGGYIPTDGADDMEILARAVLISQRTIEEKNRIIARHEAKIVADAPAVAFARDVGECEDDVTVEKFAKATFDRFEMGRNKLHAWLRENHYLTEKRIPFQKYMDNGWFRTFEILCNGHPVVVTTITGKGQRRLYEKLCEAFPEKKTSDNMDVPNPPKG